MAQNTALASSRPERLSNEAVPPANGHEGGVGDTARIVEGKGEDVAEDSRSSPEQKPVFGSEGAAETRVKTPDSDATRCSSQPKPAAAMKPEDPPPHDEPTTPPQHARRLIAVVPSPMDEDVKRQIDESMERNLRRNKDESAEHDHVSEESDEGDDSEPEILVPKPSAKVARKKQTKQIRVFCARRFIKGGYAPRPKIELGRPNVYAVKRLAGERKNQYIVQRAYGPRDKKYDPTWEPKENVGLAAVEARKEEQKRKGRK
jgi:hypothetical protein